MKFDLRVLCLALAPLAAFASVAQVETDIKAITAQAAALDGKVLAFTGAGPDAVDIHTRAQNLNVAILKATADTNATPGPVSVPDGQAVLALVKQLHDTDLKLLNNTVAKKPQFEKIPGAVAGVESDLKALNASTGLFEAAVLPKTPDALKPQAKTLANEINKAFTVAVEAFSTP